MNLTAATVKNYAKPLSALSGLSVRSALVIIATIALSLSACKARRPTIAQSEIRTDSIYVREVIRDTAIIVQADSSLMRALVECDSAGQARLKELLFYRTGRYVSAPVVTIRNNVLTATAKVDSFAVYARLFARFTEKAKAREVTIEKTVYVNRPNWWQKALMWAGALSLVFFSIKTYLKFIKP